MRGKVLFCRRHLFAVRWSWLWFLVSVRYRKTRRQSRPRYTEATFSYFAGESTNYPTFSRYFQLLGWDFAIVLNYYRIAVWSQTRYPETLFGQIQLTDTGKDEAMKTQFAQSILSISHKMRGLVESIKCPAGGTAQEHGKVFVSLTLFVI